VRGFDRDFEPAVRAWVAEGPERLPEIFLEGALLEIAVTPQRRAGRWLPRVRWLDVAGAPVIAAAAWILVAVVFGLSLLPPVDVTGRPSAPPTSVPTPFASQAPTTRSPTPTQAGPARLTAISGRFDAVFGTVAVSASIDGAGVSGSMQVAVSSRRHFEVDLNCTTTYEDGSILVGGPVTDSTHPEVPDGKRVTLVVAPGEPTTAILWFEGRRRADDCGSFLERAPDSFEDWLQPIEGDIELEFAETGQGDIESAGTPE
jgi:hypothetical protein